MEGKPIPFKLLALSTIAFVGVWVCGIVVGAALDRLTDSAQIIKVVFTCVLAVYVYGQINVRNGLRPLWLPAAKPDLLRCVFITTALSVALALGLSGLVLSLPAKAPIELDLEALKSMLQYLYPLMPKILVLPLLEEVFFRGVLLRFFASRSGIWLAIVMQSVVFVAAHFSVIEIGWNPRTLLVFLAGCFFGVAFVATQSLSACVFLHVVWNASSFALGGLSPVESASHESVVEHYTAFMWGSVALMASLLICSVAALVWARRSRSHLDFVTERAA